MKDRDLHMNEGNLEKNNFVHAFGDGPAGKKVGQNAYVVYSN